MDQQAGMPSVDDDAPNTAGRDKIVLPDLLNLSIDRLSSEGVFLLDNGVDAFIWVGRASNPATVSALFGVESLDHVDPTQITLSKNGNDLASRLDCIIKALHEESDPTLPAVAPKIQIIREGDMALEARFFWNFIEDRAQFNGGTYSYADFMEVSHTIHTQLMPIFRNIHTHGHFCSSVTNHQVLAPLLEQEWHRRELLVLAVVACPQLPAVECLQDPLRLEDMVLRVVCLPAHLLLEDMVLRVACLRDRLALLDLHLQCHPQCLEWEEECLVHRDQVLAECSLLQCLEW